MHLYETSYYTMDHPKLCLIIKFTFIYYDYYMYIDMYIARSNVSRREQIIFNAETVTLSIFFNFNFYHQ